MKSRLTLHLSTLVAVTLGLGTSLPGAMAASGDERIIGGSTVVDMTSNPGAVALGAALGPQVKPYFSCSASRIGPTWVLTAKHCVEGYAVPIKPSVVYTSHLTFGKGEMAKIKRMIAAPAGDIALVELESATAGPVVGWSGRSLSVGAEVGMYGWGLTQAAAQSLPSEVLKAAQGKVTQVTTLMPIPGIKPGPAYKVTGINGIVYKGDSGGPLVHQGAVVAVVSNGPATPSGPQDTAEFSALSGVSDWILATTGIQPVKTP